MEQKEDTGKGYPGLRIRGHVTQAEAEYFCAWALPQIGWTPFRSTTTTSAPSWLAALYLDAHDRATR